MFKLDLDKAEIKSPTSTGPQRKQGNSRKHLLLLHWLCQSLWLCGSHSIKDKRTNSGIFLTRWEYETTLPASWETCKQNKKQQLALGMEQQTGSRSGKEHVTAVYCHPASLRSMQSTSCETLGWMKHQLEARLQGEIAVTSDMQVIQLQWQRGEWKSWLKTQHSKN